MNAPGPLPFPADGHAPAGHRLGSFELRGVASRNSLGIVYRAWDHELGIAVAIKEYLPQHIARRDTQGQLQPQGSVASGAFERGREAFVEETRLLARCDHPSLLRVRQLLRGHGTVYRVMPWCQGWPLAELRREMADPPDEPALRRLMDEVLGALETWHRVGGLHGSVNPAKILLLDDDRALLLGPGLVRRAIADEAATEAGAHPFSRSFLAPEQRAGSAHRDGGPCTDFFALAQVVRYCITGMLPQPDAPTPQPLAAAIEALYFDAPHVRYDGRFLHAIDAACSTAMADRPQTATEFRDWLDHGPRRLLATPVTAASGDGAAENTPAEAAAAESQAADGARVDVDIAVDGPEPELGVSTDTMFAPRTEVQGNGDGQGSPDANANPNANPGPNPNPNVQANAHANPNPNADAKAGAGAAEEAVDAATVDLIRRVIESIPERQEPPPLQDAAAQAAFTEPILRVEAWADAPAAVPPPPLRRRGAGLRWLLGAVVLGAAACAAWQWGGLAWQPGTEAVEASAGATTAAPPAAPALEATAAPASVPTTAASSAAANAADALTAPAAPAEPAAPATPTATAEAEAPATPAAAASLPLPVAAAPPAAPQPSEPVTATAGTAGQAQPASSSAVATVVVDPNPPAAPPRRAAPEAPKRAAPAPTAARGPDSPREACGARTQFALYRCMQQQCASAAWARHEQCVRFKATDRVE